VRRLFPETTIPVPSVTSQQMLEVDRVMEEDLGIGLIQMMENAGRGLARVAADRFLDGDPQDRCVLALAGKGGNGGGVLVAARRLAAWGADVRVWLGSPPSDLAGIPQVQLQILTRLGIVVETSQALPTVVEAPEASSSPGLILDGLVGYSLAGPLRGKVADLVRWTVGQETPVLSLDVPSGLDASTGRAFDPTVKAAATFTLALPKTGLVHEGARDWVGELYLGDIGVPPEVYEPLGFEVGGLFSNGDVLRLKR
jgi:NAD(P)H-hydrate epimerase